MWLRPQLHRLSESDRLLLNPFAVFDLPAVFALPQDELERRHLDLAKAVHPDRYAQALPAERRDAANRAATVSEAFRILRDPVKRAEAIFRLAGIGVSENEVPKASTAFLMDVMEQREALSDARAAKDPAAILQLTKAIEASEGGALEALASKLAWKEGTPKEDLLPLLQQLSELRYYRRFLEEAERALDDCS